MTADTDTRPFFLRKLRPRRSGTGPHRVATVAIPYTEAKPYAAAALADEVAQLASTPEGRRNDQLNIAGFNLSQLVASGHLDHDEVWTALHSTALAIGLPEGETVTTLRSAFNAGTALPRVVNDTDMPTLAPLVPFTANQDGDLEDSDDQEPPTLRERFPALNWHALWADDTEDDWIVEPLIPARRLIALFSPPKVGKSLLMLELAVNIARGTPTLGTRLDRPRRVLYVDFENDPRGDVRARLQAMGLGPDDLDDLLYLSMPRLAYLDSNIGGLELLAIAREYEVEVVVIDTISRAVSGEENDNDTWLAFYRNTGVLLKAEGIAVIRLDHTGKDATKGMRGGSAKYGDVDAAWSLTKITDTTFRLECTANRLPIAEKVLLVERTSEPHLRHVVTTRNTGDVEKDAAMTLVHLLDTRGLPRSTGYDGASAELDAAAVAYTARTLRRALRIRKGSEQVPGYLLDLAMTFDDGDD